jgi:peptide/nickel transport system ATP-binding protein
VTYTKTDKPKQIVVQNLCKTFTRFKGFFRKAHDTVRAVDNVSLHIHQGEIVGIVGESGSGKSTLAKTVLRLLEPTSGHIFVDGQDITSLSRRSLLPYRKKMQIVFQNPAESINMRKTIGQTMHEVLFFHRLSTTWSESIERAKTLLEQVGLDGAHLAYYPHELSLGQLQRVAIARALCTAPEIIVCDECVSALDILVQAQVLNLLLQLHDEYNLSYLFISHDLRVVRHLADRVCVMYKGKIVEEGLVEEVFCNPKHPYTQTLLSSS